VFLGLQLSSEQLASFYPTTYYSFQADDQQQKQVSAFKTWELDLRQASEAAALHRDLGYPLKQHIGFLANINSQLTKQKYQQYPAYREGGRLLDVGCGGGQYLAKMRDLGWQVAGVEPGHSGVEACHQQALHVQEGVLEDAHFDEGFDFIRFEHVLEHVPDPVSTLKTAKALLKPEGHIRLLLPNWDSLPARLFQTYWYHLDTPRHLFWFTQQTIQYCVQKAGLRVHRMQVSVDYSDLADSLSYALQDKLPSLGHRLGKRRMLWKLCNKLCLPLRWWMRQRQTGTLLHLDLVIDHAQEKDHA